MKRATLAMATLALACLAVPALAPAVAAGAEATPPAVQQTRAPDARMPDARTLACFLLNSMTRAAPERARREALLRAALSSGCLALPAANPFRGGSQRQAGAGARQGALPAVHLADLSERKARHAADPLFRRCLLWAFTGYPSGLDETYCTATFQLLPSGFALTCEAYLKEGFPTPLDRKACRLFWHERLQRAGEPADPS